MDEWISDMEREAARLSSFLWPDAAPAGDSTVRVSPARAIDVSSAEFHPSGAHVTQNALDAGKVEWRLRMLRDDPVLGPMLNVSEQVTRGAAGGDSGAVVQNAS